MRKPLFLLLVGLLVAAAPALAQEPELNIGGSFVIKTELPLNQSSLNVAGSVDEATLSFKLSQGELWNASLSLGSVDASDVVVTPAQGQPTGGSAPVTEFIDDENASTGQPFSGLDFVKDADGKYWAWDPAQNKFSKDLNEAAFDRLATLNDWSWTPYAKASVVGAKLGAYTVNVNPGPVAVTVWGNSASTSEVSDAFGFISSSADADTAPKFRLATSVLGPQVTVDYNTQDNDALYVFTKLDAPGLGKIGLALQDTDVATSNKGMGASGDVQVDVGFATVKAGVALAFQPASGNDSFAFGVGADVPVSGQLKATVSYTNDGRDKASNAHKQVISAGLSYGDLASVTVKQTQAGSGDKATLNVDASAQYALTEALTLKGSVSTASDDDGALNTDDPSAYTWADGAPVGDILFGTTKVSASAEYKLTDKWTITPSVEVTSYSFRVASDTLYGTYTYFTGEASQPAINGQSTSFGVTAEYSLSDSAKASIGLKRVAAAAVKSGSDIVLGDVDSLKLTTSLSLSF